MIAVKQGEMMRRIIKSFALILTVTALAAALFGCSDEPAPARTEYSPDASFADVFYEFGEIRAAADKMLDAELNDNWWQAFDSVNSNVEAAYLANKKMVGSDKLNETDRTLNGVLNDVLGAYRGAFEIMAAARGNTDPEIIKYSYNDFTSKIISADVMWDSALSGAAQQSADQQQ